MPGLYIGVDIYIILCTFVVIVVVVVVDNVFYI